MKYSKILTLLSCVIIFTQLWGCKSTYTITSDPKGALVTLNGRSFSRTPATLSVDNPSRKSVSCTVGKEGWEGQRKDLPGKGGTFHFELKKQPPVLPPLSPVISRPIYETELRSQIDKEDGEELTCSIGDVLFHIERYSLGHEIPAVLPPRELEKFPTWGNWEGTHTYSDPNGTDLVVYTHKDYYKGDIGVILDCNGIMTTTRPYIQVSGTIIAKRWGKKQPVAFFKRERESLEVWGLRYGGKRGSDYQFEVIDQINPKEIEIVQEIMISKEEYTKGFIVKGVLVRGVSESDLGLLTYTVKDVLVSD